AEAAGADGDEVRVVGLRVLGDGGGRGRRDHDGAGDVVALVAQAFSEPGDVLDGLAPAVGERRVVEEGGRRAEVGDDGDRRHDAEQRVPGVRRLAELDGLLDD